MDIHPLLDSGLLWPEETKTLERDKRRTIFFSYLTEMKRGLISTAINLNYLISRGFASGKASRNQIISVRNLQLYTYSLLCSSYFGMDDSINTQVNHDYPSIGPKIYLIININERECSLLSQISVSV